jgi:16S rRNA (uracil1498-N3)-methyltransferase
VPVWCERSVVPRGDQLDAKRQERWRRIVTEAAEQCERGRVPEIAPPMRFHEALTEAAAGPALLAWERETERSLRSGLHAALRTATSEETVPDAGHLLAGRDDPGSGVNAANSATERTDAAALGLMVGPEGGFSSTEIAVAREAGVITVSLGPRILRTETAGPVLTALALYEAGDLAPTAHQARSSQAADPDSGR